MPFYFLKNFNLYAGGYMYKLFRLNNGLRIVIENIKYVNSVTVGLWVENGSRNETYKNNGISHFIEHMFFKGTESKSAKDIVEIIENVGGQINAFTGKESTCFYVKTLDTHLDTSLDLLSDMLFNSKFSKEDIEKEKKVIIEEIKMSNDDPEDVLSDLHFKAAFGEDPLGMSILGTEKNVMSFNRNTILKYIKEHYTPKNAVISICGNFDTNNIHKIVEKYFGKWENNNENKVQYSTPKFLQNNLFKSKKIEQLHMSLGIEGIKTGNDDIYSLMILNNILGGGASSILFQKLREEHGMCYSIYSYLSSYMNFGMITIYTNLNPAYCVDSINYIKDEIYNLCKMDIHDERLIKLKEQIKGNFVLGLESTSSRMFRNGRIALLLNKIVTPREIIQKIDAVNKETLNSVIKKTFIKGIKNSAFVGDGFNKDLINTVLEEEKVSYKNPINKNI